MSEGKLPQVLHIEPPRELVFTGPFTDVVNSTLTLRNPTEKTICFKVKTTAPKQYCVRPNSGILTSGQSKTITVMLQPLEGANPSDVGRHKFMVQTCYAPNSDVDLDNIWKQTDPSQLMYSKLMVVFDQPRSIGAVQNVGREETPASIQYSSPSASIATKVSESAGSRASGDVSIQLREEMEARKKAEADKAALQREVNELFKKNAKLQQEAQSGLAEVGVPTIQVILIAIAGLLIGLIIGKLF